MEDYKIQEMTYDEIDDILHIEELCHGEHHWSKDSFIAELNNKISSYFCVLNRENRCVGYIGIWKVINEAHITTLAIDPSYQNKKLAHKLLFKILDTCYKEKIKFLTLEVRVSNEKAIHLYEKFGFKSLGVRKKYYQDNNEDAYIMWSENIFDKKFKTLYDNLRKSID